MGFRQRRIKSHAIYGPGIPSVSTTHGMSKHLIKNGSDGFLVNTEDEWVSKLSVLIKDEDLRYKMGDIARQKIINNYSVNAVGKI